MAQPQQRSTGLVNLSRQPSEEQMICRQISRVEISQFPQGSMRQQGPRGFHKQTRQSSTTDISQNCHNCDDLAHAQFANPMNVYLPHLVDDLHHN